MNSDEQGIRDLVATWAEATRAGDTATVLGLMAEDAVFLVAGKPPMRGRAAFEKGLKGVAGFDIDSANDIQEIRVFGDWANCWNHLSVVFTPRGGGKHGERSGNVLSILQKQQGRVIVRDANLLAGEAD